MLLASVAVSGGHLIGRRVERLGPIGAVSAPVPDVIIAAVVAAAVAAAVVALLWRRAEEAIGIGAGVAIVTTMVGVYSAFDTIAGSRDCPGSQDCDTLIVPLLFPFFIATAVAASAAGLLTLVARRRLAR